MYWNSANSSVPVTTTLSIAVSVPAIHLPLAIAPRGAGLTSSASIEPRSRSPAVESVAICIAPVNAAIITNSGMNPRIVAARCCALETSTSSITIAVAATGLMPRAISRRLPISEP